MTDIKRLRELEAEVKRLRRALAKVSGVLCRKWPKHQDDGPRAMLLYCIEVSEAALSAHAAAGKGGGAHGR